VLGRFFVDRPVFASVIAIVIVLVGGIALKELPIAQYPNVAPPRVFIQAFYPGASAETVETSVTQILEQQLKGIDGMLYFNSASLASGDLEVEVTFRQGVNADIAQMQVQNKLQLALNRLPLPVQQQGLFVSKAQNDFLMVIALEDPTDRLQSMDIADFIVSTLRDPISRVDGVGNTDVFGAQYAMRVWLDPYKLAAYQLMPSDVDRAIKAQNTQLAAGEIGAQPAISAQQLNATVVAQSRLQTPEEFRQIVLKTQPDGSRVLLRDVARIELGSESYDAVTSLDGHPASGMAIMLASGANALQTARAVKARIAQLQSALPPGVIVKFPNDTTRFVERSIAEVWKTVAEAILLVILVMYVFLQNWRATVIPALAVPVVLLGTFAVLWAFGYSVNTLTLFGMVLAIGLLVDDAIVVVENVERLMADGLSPRDATLRSMREISGALVGIALVLSAVFLPMAFFGGSTGVIYRQFAITIVASMLLSVVVALTLSPALCATLLKPTHGKPQARVFRAFNRGFDRLREGFRRSVQGMLRRVSVSMLVYVAILCGLAALFMRVPTGFLPLEDQGRAIVQFILPPGATQSRAVKVATAVDEYFHKQEPKNVAGVFTVAGFSFSGVGQNAGMGFVLLAPWEERVGKENSARAITERATAALGTLRDAQVFAITPPSIQGLGQSNGFTLQLLDRTGIGRKGMLAARNKLFELAKEDKRITNVRHTALDDTPQLRVDIDQAKLGALGLSAEDVNDTLSVAWGGAYVNDFVDRGRVKRVYQRGDAAFRGAPEDLDKWFVRSDRGVMTPFSAFAKTRWVMGPQTLERFNGVPALEIAGEPAPGFSSGTAMQVIEELVQKLPDGVGSEWSSLSYQERLSSGQAPVLYALSTLVVFLCLAALYESWVIPLSVLLIVPLGILGAIAASALRGLDNDVFMQVGLVTTIGLSAKNAILIVEYAQRASSQGIPPLRAALDAASLRLRPILMTSLAFMAGVLPLALATGAGAPGRIAIGTAVLGGMISATALASLFVPVFFVLLRRIGGNRPRKPAHADALVAEET
jgi:multidrug efflux pump